MVLQDEYKKEVDKEFAKNIQRNAIRLLRLVNNILDYSKNGEGKMDMSIREIDIVKVMQNYISTVQSAVDYKGIELTFNSCKNSLKLFMDIHKIDKIGMNLFSNALKFTEKGGKIDFRIREDEKNCYIDIEDSGVEIPPNMPQYSFVLNRLTAV